MPTLLGCRPKFGAPTRGIGEMPDFLGTQRASEDGALAAGEPLLENWVAAELVVPDGGRDVAPPSLVVEADVEGRVAEGRNDIAH